MRSEIPIMSINYPTLSAAADLAHFRHFSSLFTYLPSTSVENVRQISPFYAKQTQLTNCPNRLKLFYNNELCKYYQSDESQKQTQSKPIKAKTKPIQTQLLQRAKLMQSVYIQRITMKNADMGPKNKANQILS